jgi:arginyl-tRNA synthetase
MNIFTDFNDRIKKAIQSLDLKTLSGDPLELGRIVAEPPRDPAHGDIATNAAMVLGKAVGENPRALATKIAEALAADPDIAAAEVAGPGFVNLRLSPGFWQARLGEMLDAGQDNGRSTAGAGHKIKDEYV